MDVVLKKYFWLVHLAVIGLCAGFAGRTASALVEQRWLMADDQAPPPPRRAYTPLPVERTHSKEVESIIGRNVFCSRCEPIDPADEAKGDEGPVSNEPRKTDLQLELVSTMVVPEDEQWSMAVIRDNSTKEKDPGLYRKGSLLPGGTATVERVIEKKVYLRNNNRLEFLELEGALQMAHATPNPEVVVQSGPVMAGGDPLDGEIDRGVRCSGQRCEIDRPLIDKLLANTTMLATSARFVPSIKDGRPNGFKLYAIRPSSVFGKIGLQNGDTVKAINGLEMSTPDQALGVYTKVRTASHLTVQVERRGETVTLDYSIR
jgi:general secretion pathway protein C